MPEGQVAPEWLVALTTVIPTAVMWLQQLAAALVDRSFVPPRARDVMLLAEKEVTASGCVCLQCVA